MPRIAFYSHDTVGLGHVRRNLLLAHTLTAHDPASTALLVSGIHVGAAFRMPPNVDCLTLPALTKTPDDGAYGARHLRVPLTRLSHLRARTMRAALLAFDPDVVVVDNVPRGAVGEAEPALAALKARGRTRLVLGLRDVLDEPEAVAREWRACGHHEAIERYYDQVWVYGDPSVYDMVRECRFPATTAAKIEYVGYLDRRATGSPSPADARTLASLPDRFTLCLSGGGQDGSGLALAVGEARAATTPRVVLGGPFLPDATRESLRAMAAHDRKLHFVEFSSEAAWLIERAARVVTMGGYNSVCEALAHGKQTLVVPREWPRREQAIRAERLQALGLAHVLRWPDVSPEAIVRWADARLAPPRAARIPFTALDRVPDLVAGLLAVREPSTAFVRGRRRAS